MSWNSIPSYGETNLQELQDAIGITKFSGTASTSWAQVIGGVIIQGGFEEAIPVDTNRAVAFPAPFTLQVLGIFTQAIFNPGGAQEASGLVNNVTLNGFNLGNDATQKDFYWWAIGV
jgi:hypothetical protein